MEMLPASLISAIQKNNLLPLVGAGVSMSIQDVDGCRVFPSWSELFKNAQQVLKDELRESDADLVRIFVEKESYQDAAKYAYEGLRGANWVNFIKSQFDIDFKRLDSNSAALPKSIWRLSDQIITLNYDRVLEWAYPLPGSVAVLDNNSIQELASFQSMSDRPKVWHLHGRIDNCDEIILTPNGYSNLYLAGDDDRGRYKAALQILKLIFVSKSLLFIGSSLSDIELLVELHSQQEMFSGNTGPHYALVQRDLIRDVKSKIEKLDINLNVIEFPNFGEPLVDLINHLADFKAVNSVIVSEQTIIPVEHNIKQNLKVALLCANPVDKEQEYGDLYKELSAWPWDIDCMGLSIKNLQGLDEYDYIFVESIVINNRVLIEDENFCSYLISFDELEDCIGNDPLQTKAVFMFLDSVPILNNLNEYSLPLLVYSGVSKKEIGNIFFKFFKKNIVSSFEDRSIFINSDKFIFSRPSGINCKINYLKKSALPLGIDPKVKIGFVGRSGDLEVICRKLFSLADVGGVLTVKGAGGSGKTEVVKKLIVSLSERGCFSGGIFFVDCEFISDVQQFQYRIAACFNLEETKDLYTSLCNHFDGNARLVVLDNFETLLHLKDSDEILRVVSYVCDFSNILITSRELLGLEGEIVYELRHLTSDEAVKLFLKNADYKNLTKDDLKLLREDILDVLLGNNPLAIKLVAQSTPKGKLLSVLKLELEKDFFNKISDVDLDLFDSEADQNINRKKSIYASILYSYEYLDDGARRIFELLSLFPDGINMEQFNHITKTEPVQFSTSIPDKYIKRLENSSMLESSNGGVKLQSIIGKFAAAKLKKRNDIGTAYDKAFAYNIRLLYALDNARQDARKFALSLYKNRENNFLKMIGLFDYLSVDKSDLCSYANFVSNFGAHIASLHAFIEILSGKVKFFDGKSRKEIDLIILNARYFNGDFLNVFNELKKLLPLDELVNLDVDDDELSVVNAKPIYFMEGYALSVIDLDIKHNSFSEGYWPELFVLGGLFEDYAKTCKRNFWTFDALSNLHILDINEIDAYLESLYENDHLARMQVSYVRSKNKVFDKKYIDSLVVVNPYTKGLKNIMLAFIEEDNNLSRELYEAATNELKHIKYFYVESIYFLSKHLVEVGEVDAALILKQGLELAKEHSYGYLQYLFEELLIPSVKKYTTDKYFSASNPEVLGKIKNHIDHNSSKK